MNLAEQQAFDIWYGGEPKLTFDDARKACGSDSHYELAKKIFFSSGWEFQRWLITSGFQEFVGTQSVDQPLDWEGEPDPDGDSDRDTATTVLWRIWKWMKHNEKTIN